MVTGASPMRAEPRRHRFRWWWLPVVAVPVLIAGVVVFRLAAGQSAVDVVRQYLDDVRDRDAEAALADVAQSPYGFNAAFLTADAMSDGWRVGDVRLSAGDDNSASVAAELVAGGDSVDCTFRLIRLDGDWTLVDPFVEVGFANPPVEFLQVNDQLVSLVDANPEGRNVSVKLFPGRYSFFSNVPDVLSVADSPAVLVGPSMSEDGDDGFEPDLEVTYPALTASDQVVRNAGQAVNDYLDECAEFTTSAPHECPFGVSGESIYVDDGFLYGLRDLTWSITEYPRVRLGSARDGANEPGGFAVTADDSGVATISGTARRDGSDHEFTADCAIDLESLRARVGLDGSVTVTGGDVGESTCA